MGSLRFNQIKLAGFKSFVDPTDFVIEPGLTGVVGPNGCGKSNLLEAIRWVMGANSAKAMRAKGMDDVIFSGTKHRPGRNQAFVTLSIDNSARIAPPMFNDDDTLEVTRIITKGQGSKYKVNNKTVRAKDIQLLFADASTGANSPALVRQGQINELISAKPENRRRILEEAAGISGLHTRRHEAELRLRAAETNLGRLDDVIVQIESQLLSLRRQSRQAARYKRLAGEIHEYRALLWMRRWETALNVLTQAESALAQSETQVQDTAKLAAELTRKAAELSALLPPKREEQIVAAAVLGRLNEAKNVLARDEEAAKSEITELETTIEQFIADIAREEGIIADAQVAEARLSGEFETLSAVKDTSAALDAAADMAAEAIKTRTDLEAKHTELTREIARQSAQQESLERDVTQNEARLSRLKADETSAKDALLVFAAAGPDETNLFTAALKDSESALRAARDNEQAMIKTRQAADETDRSARDKLSDMRQAHTRLDAEQDALKALLSGQDSGDWVPALSQIDVKKGYEKALAAALGDDLDAAIEDKALRSWAGATVPDNSLPDQAVALLDFVKAPQALQARLSQIGVVDDDDLIATTSSLKPGQRLVTRQGALVRWDGFEMQADAETPAEVKLKQQTRLTQIGEELTRTQASVETARSAFEAARSALNAADQNLRDARAVIPELERKDRAAQAALARYETDIARDAAKKTALEERLDRLSQEIKDVTTQYETAASHLKGANMDTDLVSKQSEIGETLTQARQKADEASAAYLSLKNETEARTTRLNAVTQEREAWAKRSKTAHERVSTLKTRLEKSEIQRQAIGDGSDQFTKRRQKLFEELDVAEARRKAATDALSQAEAEAQQADTSARAAETTHASARESRAAAQATFEAAKERITETQARIHETLSCEPDNLEKELGDLSPDLKLSEHDIERKLERLQKERERMGGVNLRADEEAAEQEERLSAMNGERQDLMAAIARLREGIDELNKEGRERLLKAFDTVNAHFTTLFTTLFGGGQASLTLTESDDPLEAGLEIMVSPPGKRLGSMSLMSGGEQALTAIALIFAVFLSNPAPICVLDEVDAPLDDTNVARYCNMLDEMIRQTETKFIAITHNAVTMSRMHRLFGVTMAEQGVSQLLSIELASAEKLVASS